MVIDDLKMRLIEPAYQRLSNVTKRIIAKDFLISYLLAFIYKHKDYRKLVFYGGTCARVVYKLNRLSEDIDLENTAGVNLNNLKNDLEKYIVGTLKIEGGNVYTQIGEGGISRFIVRLPILYAIGLSPLPSEKLHVKIEISKHKQTYVKEVTTVMRDNQVLAISHFNKSSLMAGKMLACIERVFRKGKTEALVKGRDWYDLWWYLNEKVTPNEEKLKADGEKPYMLEEAWKILDERVSNLRKEDLVDDLRSFFLESVFVESWLDNFQDFYRRGRGQG
jgi:predicted nucleotidyltransferase component of viral defense system